MHAAHSRESHVASMKTGAFYSQKSSLKQGDGGLRWHSQCSCCTENHENRFLLTHLAPLSPGNSREPWGFAYSRTGMRLIPESRLDRPAHICTPITRDLTSSPGPFGTGWSPTRGAGGPSHSRTCTALSPLPLGGDDDGDATSSGNGHPARWVVPKEGHEK